VREPLGTGVNKPTEKWLELFAMEMFVPGYGVQPRAPYTQRFWCLVTVIFNTGFELPGAGVGQPARVENMFPRPAR